MVSVVLVEVKVEVEKQEQRLWMCSGTIAQHTGEITIASLPEHLEA